MFIKKKYNNKYDVMYHTDKAQVPKHEFQKSSGDTKSKITMTVAIQPYCLLGFEFQSVL